MVHELAHQWFGNSVSPWEWSDLWLNEGHASWYESSTPRRTASWRATPRAPGPTGSATLVELMRRRLRAR